MLKDKISKRYSLLTTTLGTTCYDCHTVLASFHVSLLSFCSQASSPNVLPRLGAYSEIERLSAECSDSLTGGLRTASIKNTI
jgi:hypothetical protein